MGEIETQQLEALKDPRRKQRVVAGWIGIVLGAVACLVGLYRGNDMMVGVAFVAVLFAGNVLPYEHVRALIPWGGK